LVEHRATVTFLFTDIEGSTRLLQALGDRFGDVLERHRELIRDAVAAQGGEEVGTEGDSFFVTFPSATGAIAAVVAAQRALAEEPWPDGSPVRVRMGLHTGEADYTDGTYIGLDVHRAARISAAGHGGQVLISEATRALTESSLARDVTVRDLGTHRLKDLDAPEHLYQLVIAGLPADFPSVRTTDATPNNLPAQLTSFLGREREILEISDLLSRSRLLTLTGPGGTGKTRLSIEVARRAMDRFPDGVFFVPLSPLNEVELVAPTIAHALGLPDRGGRMPEQRILDHVGDKRVLLVLDNFEQLVAAAPVVNELLGKAVNLTVLVTSRETLHLYGEQEYPVPPLGLPPTGALRGSADADAVSQYEAVALFIERATGVKPDFRVTNQNAPALAELCVRLDGLPLAIELAAARIRILTPDQILHRLGDRLDLLAGGGSDRPERQKTLRGAIAWSYDLLDDAEQRLFAGLSVFVGGATLEAVEDVCGPFVQGDVLDAIVSLVEKSLVRQRSADDGEARFSMLHTIHEYATERAEEIGSATAVASATPPTTHGWPPTRRASSWARTSGSGWTASSLSTTTSVLRSTGCSTNGRRIPPC
jgi:predicted ATPase/class 3 adenylate cyclase